MQRVKEDIIKYSEFEDELYSMVDYKDTTDDSISKIAIWCKYY
jgi:hypothetical protein